MTATTYVEPVAYATPVPRTGARMWAGALIVLAGLALIVLGGCFLIGVMLTVTDGFNTANPTPTLTASERVFIVTLYTLALASFAAAVWLLFLGIRGLLRTLQGVAG